MGNSCRANQKLTPSGTTLGGTRLCWRRSLGWGCMGETIGSVVWRIKSPTPRNSRCTRREGRTAFQCDSAIWQLTQCCVWFPVWLHQCEVPVHSLSHLRPHVLLCLGGWVHGRPRSVHRSVSRAPARTCTDGFTLITLVHRGHALYWRVWAVSGGHSRTDVPQPDPGAGLPTSRHG